MKNIVLTIICIFFTFNALANNFKIDTIAFNREIPVSINFFVHTFILQTVKIFTSV